MTTANRYFLNGVTAGIALAVGVSAVVDLVKAEPEPVTVTREAPPQSCDADTVEGATLTSRDVGVWLCNPTDEVVTYTVTTR